MKFAKMPEEPELPPPPPATEPPEPEPESAATPPSSSPASDDNEDDRAEKLSQLQQQVLLHCYSYFTILILITDSSVYVFKSDGEILGQIKLFPLPLVSLQSWQTKSKKKKTSGTLIINNINDTCTCISIPFRSNTTESQQSRCSSDVLYSLCI